MNTNVDAEEIGRFDDIASSWWDPQGEMAPLHVINGPRLRYIEQRVGGLRGQRVIDVGCGGGLLTEALAVKGAQVTGIDLAERALAVASEHARASSQTIEYRAIAAEDLAQEQPGAFDVVCCLEMLEHVPDPGAVVAACAKLVRCGGHVIFSTINRNPKSYALMIVAAEGVLRLLPRGTHDYAKFIRPSELDGWARAADLVPRDVTGMRYNPLLRSARLHPSDLDVNYLMHCQRP